MDRKALLVAIGLTALVSQAAGAASPTIAPLAEYQRAIGSTMADNQAQAKSNQQVAYNIVCAILPFDVTGDFPSWHGSGSGSWEASANRLHVKATDTASFGGSCFSPDSGSFSVEVRYVFQYYRYDHGKHVWTDLTPATGPFTCSTGSTSVGAKRAAHIQVPGTPGCAFEQIYQTSGAANGKPHRLQIELVVSTGGAVKAPYIKGWSLPWPMMAVLSRA